VRPSRNKWLFASSALAVALVLFAASAGHLLVIDSRQPADVILVLAGETDYRPALARDLFQKGFGRRVVIDVPASAKIYEFTQLQLAEKFIQDLPQPAAFTVCPITGLSTRDESHDAEKCLGHDRKDQRVLIVTSDFHTRRALSIFRHELRGRTFSTAAAEDATQFGTRWWTHREWAKTCLYEWLRLIWWQSVDRWRTRS